MAVEPRDIITIITQGDKDPLVMGFKLLGADDPVVLGAHVSDDIMVVPDDQIEGVEIEVEQMQQGAQVPLEGRLVRSAITHRHGAGEWCGACTTEPTQNIACWFDFSWTKYIRFEAEVL